MDEIVSVRRLVNGISVEQRVSDGFINATMMCLAHDKDIYDWLKQDSTRRIVFALAKRLGIEIKTEKNRHSVIPRLSDLFPSLLVVRRGSPINGGGTWIHYKLAVNLAQWCNEEFALLVSDWIEEWLIQGTNPFRSDQNQEFKAWEERYNFRKSLREKLRPDLMDSVVEYAFKNKINAIKLCSQVHDQINIKIQGLNSKQIKKINSFSKTELIRDYFDTDPLITYLAINRLTLNAIKDYGIHPVSAVDEACNRYLGLSYSPSPITICENLYSAGKRIRAAQKRKQLSQSVQLSLFDCSA